MAEAAAGTSSAAEETTTATATQPHPPQVHNKSRTRQEKDKLKEGLKTVMKEIVKRVVYDKESQHRVIPYVFNLRHDKCKPKKKTQHSYGICLVFDYYGEFTAKVYILYILALN